MTFKGARKGIETTDPRRQRRKATFEVGDNVRMPGVPFTLTVLEVGVCDEEDCPQAATFRFADPESGEDDWAHQCEFEKVDE